MRKKVNSRSKRLKSIALILLVFGLTTMACVRTAGTQEGIGGGESSDAVAETKDAQVQMTLSALLGSATAELGEAAANPTDLPPTSIQTEPPENTQLTQLASTLTAAAEEATATETAQFGGAGTETPTESPSETPALCYVHRYVYDETFPDGTRVDPDEKFQKTWRLQNMGTCDWVAGEYELTFESGIQMGGQSPLTINYTVEAGGYADFNINLTAPSIPGTYRGYWILQTTGGDPIGWGPNADQAFWVEIVVRGATPTPTPTP